MFKYFSARKRPMHLGPYPLEHLKRADRIPHYTPAEPLSALDFEDNSQPYAFVNSMGKFIALLTSLRDGMVAPTVAPVPDDPGVRAKNLKSWCYHEGMDQAGVCEIPAAAILETPLRGGGKVMQAAMAKAQEMSKGATQNPMFAKDEKTKSTLYGSGQQGGEAGSEPAAEEAQQQERKPSPQGPGPAAGMGPAFDALDKDYRSLGHTHALVILTGFKRDPKPGEPGYGYIHGSQLHRAAAYAGETAVLVAGFLRTLGFSARAHTMATSDLDFYHLMLASGLGELRANGARKVVNPYLGERFGIAVVSTAMELAPDKPLAPRGLLDDWSSHGPRYWFGTGGLKPAIKFGTAATRPLHTGNFPQEKIKRVDKPTTLVDEASIPRVPKRHDFFIRGAIGDLGKDVKKSMDGLALMLKEPYNHTTMRIIGGCVPLQYGKEADQTAPGSSDPKANSDMIKALCTYTGADLVGITKAVDYAWYSHDHDGTPIEPYHKNAIILIADQGFETMDGSSGDDWICGSQGTKSYRRASLYAGMVAEQIRRMGYPARCHTVVDQDVLHIPLLLNAGLGELSRIGEVLLTPFLGPRFKSSVITTDMPLEYDKPIDFGLQDFCEKCTKCARECPVGAIPWGDKIMFNGAEMWKPDVEKCAKYRITNPAGCGCGRCIKVCPWNLEGVLGEAPFRWLAINMPFTRKWLVAIDEKFRRNAMNPVKRWWFNVAWINGKCVKPKKTNERALRFHRSVPEEQTTAIWPLDLTPAPDQKGVFATAPLRKEARKRYKNALRPEDYKKGETGQQAQAQ